MFACLYVPDFSVQSGWLCEAPETRARLSRSPFAILDGPANLQRVFATNEAARRLGIAIGMTKLQVETYGGVELRKRSVAAEEFGQKTLVELAGEFSPWVESTCHGVVILGLAGTERLLGPWKVGIHRMTKRAAAAGFSIRIAVAANPDTAFHAVRGFSSDTIIAKGEEACSLGPLRTDLLPITPQVLGVLDGWGIRTFQSFAALPEIAVVERLGQEGLQLQKLARGVVNRPLLPLACHAEFVERHEFEEPVEAVESLAFVLNMLLQQLCSKLMATSLAVNELKLMIGLEVRQIQSGQEGERHEHVWKLPVPTQEKNLLLRLIRLYLDQVTFAAPVRSVRIEAIPVKPRVGQGNLFAPPSPEPEKLAITLERICGVVGQVDEDGIGCVGSPQLVDTHEPGRFTVEPFSSDIVSPRSFPQISPIHALRCFRPAIAITVELKEEKPHFVRIEQKTRRVLAGSGPWSSSGDWWNPSVWTREEWDVVVQLSGCIGLYRIYRNRIRRQWWLEGFFD